MSDIDTWPHTPSARATIPSGEDAGNPNGWTDNLLVIKTAVNSKQDKPAVAGTAGQVFQMGASAPEWATFTDRRTHTWTIPGEVKVPSGSTNYIMPFFVGVASGQTVKLVKARHVIYSGTSVTCKLTKNGVDITGFTGISVTTSAATTDPDDVSLTDEDELALVVTAVSGTPLYLSFTIFLDSGRG